MTTTMTKKGGCDGALGTRNLNAAEYSNLSSDFYIQSKDFTRQYAPLYAERLRRMRTDVISNALAKWTNKFPVKQLVDLETNEKCIVVGTLFKEMKYKPDILKELAEDENNQIVFQPVLDREKYINDDAKTNNGDSSGEDDENADQLILEDEMQRIQLTDWVGCQPQEVENVVRDGRLCTGLVIALLGRENEQSKFEIEDFCFKYTPVASSTNSFSDLKLTEKERESEEKEGEEQPKFIVFLSGLELGGNKAANTMIKFQMLVDFLRGDFMSSSDNEEEDDQKKKKFKKLNTMLTNTIRFCIAGNSLSRSTQSKEMNNQAKYLTKNFVVGSVTAAKELDTFLAQLVDKLEVDVMPGEYDPSNLMVPQQPLHTAIFTDAKKYNPSQERAANMHTTTNPYRFRVSVNESNEKKQQGSVELLGTSGQFVDDIRRSTCTDDPIDLMKLTLQAGHLAPTCPDTLACYPYYAKDPFVLDELPHVYFVGNQKEFKHDTLEVPSSPSQQTETKTEVTEKTKKIHLLSLPKFCETNSCVFLNLSTLESEEIFF